MATYLSSIEITKVTKRGPSKCTILALEQGMTYCDRKKNSDSQLVCKNNDFSFERKVRGLFPALALGLELR